MHSEAINFILRLHLTTSTKHMSDDTHTKIAIIIASTFIASGTGGVIAYVLHIYSLYWI